MISSRSHSILSFALAIALVLLVRPAFADVEIVVKNEGKTDFQVFSVARDPSGLGVTPKLRVEGWTTVPGRRTRTIRSGSNSSSFALGFVTAEGFHPMGFTESSEIDTDFPPLVAIRPGTDFRINYSDPDGPFPEGFVAAGVSTPMKIPANGRYRVLLNINLDPGKGQPYPFLPLSSREVRKHMRLLP
ncbi:MAG: hypothetical protein GYB53_16605 [Rhodobacteraceae bacterium]|nr:hypothetical protein [Paracoccaceae bacterium]MBR9823107.1 hypothetical protein [Paracoccaceae bacterium]